MSAVSKFFNTLRPFKVRFAPFDEVIILCSRKVTYFCRHKSERYVKYSIIFVNRLSQHRGKASFVYAQPTQKIGSTHGFLSCRLYAHKL